MGNKSTGIGLFIQVVAGIRILKTELELGDLFRMFLMRPVNLLVRIVILRNVKDDG